MSDRASFRVNNGSVPASERAKVYFVMSSFLDGGLDVLQALDAMEQSLPLTSVGNVLNKGILADLRSRISRVAGSSGLGTILSECLGARGLEERALLVAVDCVPAKHIPLIMDRLSQAARRSE